MGKKILLADDSITIQKVIELTFSDEDFEVVTVGNGRSAVEKVQDVRPDVVLCDIIMPEKDGYEVCEFIKKNPSLSHIPVLLLTGAFEPFDQERASRVGCDGFLAKPFEPQALIAKVKDLLRQATGRPGAAAAPSPAAEAPAIPAVPAAPPSPPEPPPVSSWASEPEPLPWEAPAAPPARSPAWPEPSGRAEEPERFIPAEPFAEEPVPGPDETETVRVPAYDSGAFVPDAPLRPEPYPLESAPAPEDELLPMTPEEEESLSEPISWQSERETEPPAAEPAGSSGAEPAVEERDLFLEEMLDENAPAGAAAAASTPAAAEWTASSEPPGDPEPEPASAAAPASAAYEPLREPEPPAAPPAASAAAARSWDPEPEPEPEPVMEREMEPEMEESFGEVTPEPAPAEASEGPSAAGGVAVPMDMVSQIAQRVVAQISEKVIREIAWEVIPDMAEALIKQEIERLTAELRRS